MDTNVERCVCCGEIIPEGRMVCPICENQGKDYNIILKKIGDCRTLIQLAEEAAELSAACSKLARIIDGKNPSPKSYDDAKAAVIEEIADVVNSVNALCWNSESGNIQKIINKKKARWISRLLESKR